MQDPTGQRFSVETATAEIRGTRFGDGPAMLLLHGGPGCYDYFSGSVLVDWLAATHTVWCYDQRGCRDSRSRGPVTSSANVDDLEAIRRFTGEDRVVLLGHSAGAILAVHFAAAHPDRVECLILMSPAGARGGWQAAFDETIRGRLSVAQTERLRQIDREILDTLDPAERAALYRRRFNVVLPCYVDARHRSLAPTMAHFHREVNVQVNASIQATYRDAAWQAGLRRFVGRAGIIHGRSDPIPWEVADDLVGLLPRAEVFPLERCGHFPWLERPDACRRALVAFLHEGG